MNKKSWAHMAHCIKEKDKTFNPKYNLKDKKIVSKMGGYTL